MCLTLRMMSFDIVVVSPDSVTPLLKSRGFMHVHSRRTEEIAGPVHLAEVELSIRADEGRQRRVFNGDPSDSRLPMLGDETGNGSVERPLHLRGKQTPGKLPKPTVVSYALTTFPLFVARFIGAGALPLVQLEITFGHGSFLLPIIAASLRAHI